MHIYIAYMHTVHTYYTYIYIKRFIFLMLYPWLRVCLDYNFFMQSMNVNYEHQLFRFHSRKRTKFCCILTLVMCSSGTFEFLKVYLCCSLQVNEFVLRYICHAYINSPFRELTSALPTACDSDAWLMRNSVFHSLW